MLSFELKGSGADGNPDEMEIFVDDDGLKSLMSQLKFLLERQTDHVHMMAESWGGSHLSEEPQGKKNISIRHVKVLKIP